MPIRSRRLQSPLRKPHEGANTMLKHAIIALSLLSLPAATQAQDAGRANDSRNNHGPEHAHGSKGPHGGVVQDIAGYEGELLPGNGTVVLRSEEHTSELQSLMRISYA